MLSQPDQTATVQRAINHALDHARQRDGLTEQALAERIGVNISTLWRWRRGQVADHTNALISLILETRPPSCDPS